MHEQTKPQNLTESPTLGDQQRPDVSKSRADKAPMATLPHVTAARLRHWLNDGLEALEMAREDGEMVHEWQGPIDGYLIDLDEEHDK